MVELEGLAPGTGGADGRVARARTRAAPSRRRGSSSRSRTRSTRARRTTARISARRPGSCRARGREEGLLRRRHVRLRRHAADRHASIRQTSPSCRSAGTSRWIRARPRVACELLGAQRVVPVPLRDVPAPGGHARPAQAARAGRRRRSHRAGRNRSRCERALVRRDRAARSGDRGRGRARRSTTRSCSTTSSTPRAPARGARGRDGRSSCAPRTPEEIKPALSHPEVATALVPADRRDLLDVDLRELTYGP